jgi:hypothetical protein
LIDLLGGGFTVHYLDCLQAVNNGTDAVYAVGLSPVTLEPTFLSIMWWYAIMQIRVSIFSQLNIAVESIPHFAILSFPAHCRSSRLMRSALDHELCTVRCGGRIFNVIYVIVWLDWPWLNARLVSRPLAETIELASTPVDIPEAHRRTQNLFALVHPLLPGATSPLH